MITLATQAEVEHLLASPGDAWLFKHSATCGISAEAQRELGRYIERHPTAICGVVVVQSHRPVSNWIATALGYTHQTPQLFLLRQGKVVWQASHWSITAEAMEAAAT